MVALVASVIMTEPRPAVVSASLPSACQSGAGGPLTRRRIPATRRLSARVAPLERGRPRQPRPGVSLGFAAVRERRRGRVDGLLERRTRAARSRET
jgi:hypothetical protein